MDDWLEGITVETHDRMRRFADDGQLSGGDLLPRMRIDAEVRARIEQIRQPDESDDAVLNRILDDAVASETEEGWTLP